MADPAVFYSAPRDASAVNRPNVRSVKRVHIALTEDGAPAGPTDRTLFAACSGVPLDEDGVWPAGRTAASVRCRRAACATRFTQDADRVAARRAGQGGSATGWWQCQNSPPCPHAAVFHDTDGDLNKPDTCCIEGCGCGEVPR